MGAYIRVRFRTRPPLVASPSRPEQSQLNQLKQSQLSSRQNKPKPATIFSLIHAKHENIAPTNARKVPSMPLQASSIVGYYERVRIDYMALCLSAVLHCYVPYVPYIPSRLLPPPYAIPPTMPYTLDPCPSCPMPTKKALKTVSDPKRFPCCYVTAFTSSCLCCPTIAPTTQ